MAKLNTQPKPTRQAAPHRGLGADKPKPKAPQGEAVVHGSRTVTSHTHEGKPFKSGKR